MSVLFVFDNNFLQSRSQEHRIEAYYIAYSGIEMAYSALIANSEAKLKELTRATAPVSQHTQTGLVIGDGKVDLVAKLATDPNFDGWVIITAKATLDKNGFSYTRSLLFDPSDPTNPSKRVWKDN